MAIASNFYQTLLEHNGTERVVDVFEGTGIEARPANLEIGAWVVRGAIGEELALEWHGQFMVSLTSIANYNGESSVRLKRKQSVVPHDPMYGWALYVQA